MTEPSHEYAQRVDSILSRAAEFVAGPRLEDARRLAEHGEGPEALSMLAWAIINDAVKVPAGLVEEIKYFSEGYTYPEDFPQGLDSCAIAGA